MLKLGSARFNLFLEPLGLFEPLLLTMILLYIQAFPKRSPLLHVVSRAVLQVTEGKIMNISNQWFEAAASCDQQNRTKGNSSRLMLDSFKGLFLIVGLSSTAALLIFFFIFLYQNRQILVSRDSVSRKLAAMAKTFDVFMEDESGKTISEAIGEESNNGSPGIHDEQGFASTEPEIHVHETIQILEFTIK
ncbi:hypothetical protein Hanom_Chr10g00948081 [Helianthus anomalus]